MRTLKARLSHLKAAVSSKPKEYNFLGLPTEPPAPSENHKGNILHHFSASFDVPHMLHKYEDQGRTPHPDYVTNFLGVRIDVSPWPEFLETIKGTVESVPIPANWHADMVEWGSTLRAVDEADGVFRAVEVGCGWGCWLNNLGVAAKRAGLTLDLVGIEGSAHHLTNAEQLLRLNGIGENEVKLVHGVAAEKSDRAMFPISEEGAYGAEPVFFPDQATYDRLVAQGGYEELRTFTLPELSDGQVIDLLHVDIQGSELDFVKGNWAEITQLVKRVFIGTHGRIIDGALMSYFLEQKWILEAERPSVEEVHEDKLRLQIDGVQMWRNPTL